MIPVLRPALMAAVFLSACAPRAPETVTKLDLVAPEGACWKDERLPDGSPRRYQVPCPEVVTAEFIASVQRALAARNLYQGPISGQQNEATAEAVRTYQATLGIWSSALSVEAGRKLGLLPQPADN